METRHSDKYTVEECHAYKELAATKWKDGFVCARPGCGYDKYFEGKTPYSRRCIKCKRDESAKAHTIFDKLRMSLPVCMEIVNIVLESERRLYIEELVEHLKKYNDKAVNKKSVSALVEKIHSRIKERIGLKSVYKKDAIFIAIVEDREIILISRGYTNNQLVYNLNILKEEAEMYSVVEKYSSHTTGVAAFSLVYINSMPRIMRRNVSFRHAILCENDEAIQIVKEVYNPKKNPVIHFYKNNRNRSQDLKMLLIS